MTTSQQTTQPDAVKALAIAQRDWYIAQARIAMKAAKAIERQYPDIAPQAGKHDRPS